MSTKTMITKPYRVKNTAVEQLAITLYNEDGQYGAPWLSVSETTRNKYREMAQGERDLPNNAVNRRRAPVSRPVDDEL